MPKKAFITVEIKIKGHVQGVFFRKNTQKQANKLSIKGYVKNLSNGSVICVASGLKENIDKLITYCKQGPPQASVEEVIITPIQTSLKLSSFKILV